MIITGKTKMRDLQRANVLIKYSDIDLAAQVRKYKVEKQIAGMKVADIYSLSMGDVIDIWNIQNETDLLNTTKHVFLLNSKLNRFIYRIFVRKDENLPLIDFSRLLIHTQETGEFIAAKFAEIKPIYSDDRIKDIVAKYKSTADEMILRFCKLYPAYNFKTARNLCWYDIYMAFANDTKNQNIQVEYSRLKPLEK